mgnify:CR=1 FL=1
MLEKVYILLKKEGTNERYIFYGDNGQLVNQLNPEKTDDIKGIKS